MAVLDITPASSSSGSSGWSFVSYSTSTSGLTVAVSSLVLSTALNYKIIYQAESDGSTNSLYMRINGISTSTYNWLGNRVYQGASVASELRNGINNTLWYLNGGNGYKSNHGELLLSLTKTGTAGSYRPTCSFNDTGKGNGTSDDYMQSFVGSGIQTSQTDVTSLTIGYDGGTNANLRVWVFKSAQA